MAWVRQGYVNGHRVGVLDNLRLHTVLATLVGMLGLAIAILVVCIAGLALPFRRKELFEKPRANYRVAGMPVISIPSLRDYLFALHDLPIPNG